MITLLLHRLRLVPFLCGGHRQLALENLALHQQLAVYKRSVTRPKLRTTDRLFFSEAACQERKGRWSYQRPLSAAAPSGSRLSTSAKKILALTAHSPRLTAERSIGLPPLAVYAARRAVIGPRTLVAS